MILKVFAVYDEKAEIFAQPFFMANKGTALRAMSNVFAKPEHEFTKFPQDYTIYELGEYDDSNGRMLPYDKPQHVCRLSELKTDSRYQPNA